MGIQAGHMTPESREAAYIRQYELETVALKRTVDRYRALCENVINAHQGAALKPSQRLLVRWFKPLSEAIDEEQGKVWSKTAGVDRGVYGPYLVLLPPEILAVLTINEALNVTLYKGGSATFLQTCTGLGRIVMAEVQMMKLKKENRKEWERLQTNNTKMHLVAQNTRRALNETSWSQSVMLKVGCCLMDLLIKHADIPVAMINKTGRKDAGLEELEGGAKEATEPAFKHRIEMQANLKKVGVISAHPFIETMMDSAMDNYMFPVLFPMLVPPRDWTRHDSGAYIKQRVSVMRIKGNAEIQVEALKKAEMPLVYEGLNTIGRVPYRINQRVHDVVLKAWEAGGGIGDLPVRVNLPEPAPLMDDAFYPSPEAKAAAIRKHKVHCYGVKRKNAELHSLRCDMRLKLDVAEMFRNDVIYFPHNLDFRGRAYPIPPHLNHMGSDISRGLLTFAEGKPLGERGFEWLQIHLSNLAGYDKASNLSRKEFTLKHLEDIMDSADRPLEGKRWWLKSENPFQTLAACYEMTDAIRSGDPHSYVCNLPVHQDGSCNGLQHYAALGRDALGGAAVNLTPSEQPQDVYTGVLKAAIKVMESHRAEVPPPEGDQLYPGWKHRKDMSTMLLEPGMVDRRVIKQTVMTSVYGVTMIGARNQIASKLKEKFEDAPLEEDVKAHTVNVSSAYLAKVVLQAIGNLFSAADGIKEWLATCARLVALQNQPMSWITPLGLPVVQPYRRNNALIVKTLLQDVQVIDQDDLLPVSITRQRSAFPPNYVHSLDSTHMMMTAIECKKRGITFTAVHDSYWTHACDVDTMSTALRDQFVELYSLPLLENLRESLRIRFPLVTFPPVPPRGDLDLNLVRQSKYFFS